MILSFAKLSCVGGTAHALCELPRGESCHSSSCCGCSSDSSNGLVPFRPNSTFTSDSDSIAECYPQSAHTDAVHSHNPLYHSDQTIKTYDQVISRVASEKSSIPMINRKLIKRNHRIKIYAVGIGVVIIAPPGSVT